nr:hypothetical protein [Tanacetum cinerariifolium]
HFIHEIIRLVAGEIDPRFLVYLRQLLVGRAGGEAEGQGKKGRFQAAEGPGHKQWLFVGGMFFVLDTAYTSVMLNAVKHLYRIVG